MRLFWTFTLCLAALITGMVALMHFFEQDVSRLFGKPPIKKQERIYTFNPNETQQISVLPPSGSQPIILERSNGFWQVTSPYQDRADPRIAGYLLAYSRNLIVEDFLSKPKLPSLAPFGFPSQATQITLTTKDKKTQASYQVGLLSPWEVYDEESKQYASTSYLLPQEPHHSNALYLCNSLDQSLLKNKGSLLRDHRPLLCSPSALSQVEITHNNISLTLHRNSITAPWKIIKPIELRTDPEAINALLKGLQTLTADHVYNRGTSSLKTAPKQDQITFSIQAFSTPETPPSTTTFIIHPQSSSPQSTHYLGEVSDRPNTHFSIPSKDIEHIPFSINQLRDKTLTGISVKDIHSVRIESQENHPINLRLIRNNHSGQLRWMTGSLNQLKPANETSVAQLFTAITQSKALNFATDHPTELKRYGLHTPQKTITLYGNNSMQVARLFLGTMQGRYYAYLDGSSSILEISSDVFQHVYSAPQQWKDTLLWHFPLVDLTHLIIQRRNQTPLILEYQYITESWRAFQKGSEVTSNLNQNRASKLLLFLENARVSRWLSPNNRSAKQACIDPDFKLAARFKPSETFPKGRTLTLKLSRVQKNPQNTLFYLQSNATSFEALVDIPFAQRLAVDLMED